MLRILFSVMPSPVFDRTSIVENVLAVSIAAADLNSTHPAALNVSAPTPKLRLMAWPLTWTKSTNSDLTACKRDFTLSGVMRQAAPIVLKFI